MTALHERLQDVIAEMRRAVKGEAVTSIGDWADRLEAAQALQASGGEVVDKGPWHVGKDGRDVFSDDFGADVALRISGDFVDDAHQRRYADWLAAKLNASPAQPSGFVLVPVEPTEEFRRIFGFMGLSGFSACYAEMLTAAQSAPSPSAALQAGEV